MIWLATQVALGGAIGSVLRFLTISVVGGPMATFAVNVAGSLAMGALFVALGPRLSPLLMTGVLGGYTTFSAFALDSASLWMRDASGLALLYIGLTLVGSLGAVALGLWLGAGWTR